MIEDHTYDLGGASTNSTYKFICTIIPLESFEETHVVTYLEEGLEIEEVYIVSNGEIVLSKSS